MTLAEKIRKLRREKGLSLERLARKAEISKSYLWQLEKEKSKKPSAETLYRISTALRTTIADLLELEIKISAEDKENLPPGLKELVEERDLQPEDVKMLANIQYRGRRPRTKEDWNFIYQAIIKSVEE